MSDESVYVDVNKVLVPHAGYCGAMKKMNQIFRRSEGRSTLLCLTLVGETGTGKTSLLNEFAAQHPPQWTDEGLISPVVMITVPAVPSIRALVGRILEKLVASDQVLMLRESEEDRTIRAKKLVKSCGVRMIILEEFQHFVERGDKRVIAAADWLKVFLDQTKVMAVISGLDSSRQILDKNSQLARRFSSNIRLSRFDWEDMEMRTQFQGILLSFQSCLNGITLPDIGSDQVAFRFFMATGGLISNIPKLLEQALWDAEDEGRTEITIDNLATAWDASIRQPQHGDDNPFRLKGLLNVESNLDRNLLAFARSITAPQEFSKS